MISHTAYVVCTNCGQELGRKLGLSPEVLAVAMRAPLPNCQDCRSQGKTVFRWFDELAVAMGEAK